LITTQTRHHFHSGYHYELGCHYSFQHETVKRVCFVNLTNILLFVITWCYYISLSVLVVWHSAVLYVKCPRNSCDDSTLNIDFKYKTLATCQPSYLYNLLQLYQPSWALRSSTQQLLQVPYMSTDFGRHAFSYSSPATWNSIHTSIKNCSSLYSFKRHLKSHLIAQLINNKHTLSGHLVTCPRLQFMLNVWLCTRYKFLYYYYYYYYFLNNNNNNNNMLSVMGSILKYMHFK